MPAGTRVRPHDLAKKLKSLDIDEGLRIESKGYEMFVNRAPSGTFVVQSCDGAFYYLDRAAKVAKLVKITFKDYYSPWAC